MSPLRRTLHLLVALALFVCPVLTAQERPDRDVLERQILTGLAKGQDVTPQVELWLGDEDAARRAQRPQSQVGRELRDALAALRRALPRTEAGLPEALAAYETLRGADLLMRDHFRSVARRLGELGVGGDVTARLTAAETRYVGTIERIYGAVDPPLAAFHSEGLDKASPRARVAVVGAFAAVGEQITAALATSSPPILRASVLPYRPASLATRPPKTEPAVVPSYLDPTAGPPSAADYAATLEAPLDEEILELAASLGYDYVKIYELVRNEIQTEHYAGSMKGALGTLRSGAGNDVDQASLLIALLRASKAAARYVHGVIELPVEDVALDLGLADPSRVPTALARAGVAHRGVIRGGRVAAVEVEHTWVAAYVPYTNYRGAVVDFSGRTWLPLAPAIKTSDRTDATGVLRRMELAVDELVAEHLAALPPEDVLSDLRRQVGDYLQENEPGATYEDQLGSRTVSEQRLGLLPNTLAAPVTAITGEAAALDDEKRVRLRFVARTGPGESDPVALDAELPLSQLAAGRVTFSYLPATVEDHRTVNAFGGFAGVPLYLVRVRPQIKVQGRPALVGEGSLELGLPHRFEVEVVGPAGSERISQTVIAGSFHALAAGVQELPPSVPEDGDLADTESLAASLLAGIGLRFTESWTAGEEELGGLLDVAVLRPLPSLALVSNAVAVEEVLDLPFQLRFQGVTLDAALRVAEPLARGDDGEAARDWMRLSALYGSSLEHRVFEDDFLVESISADKGLGLAGQAGTEVLRLEGEGDPRLELLTEHPQVVRDDVANWLRLGMAVEIPVAPLTYNAWTGSTWRVEDGASGAGGYFIAGGLAGGGTSENVADWLLDFLRDALENPSSSEPNPDPFSGDRLVKVPATDGQQATVGQVLPQTLAAMVFDTTGRPVKGAPVVFFVGTSGGKLLDSEGTPHESLAVPTDSSGYASVRLRLGTDTDKNPFYANEFPEDLHASKALLHRIEATALGAQNRILTTDTPFWALGFPDKPVSMLRVGTTETGFEEHLVGTHVDTMTISVEDQYQNPVSNVPVTFAAGTPEVWGSCPNHVPEHTRNAVIFDPAQCPVTNPALGDCGESSLTVHTTPAGINAGVILGNDFALKYRVDVTTDALDEELSYFYTVPTIQFGNGDCRSFWSVGMVKEAFLLHEGNNVNAARAGSDFARPIKVSLVYWKPKYVTSQDAEGKWSLSVRSDGEIFRSTGKVEFEVDNGGRLSPTIDLGEGVYQTVLTTGFTPALNTVRARATEVKTFQRYEIDETTGTVTESFTTSELAGIMSEVWSVEPRVTAIDPDPLVLTDAGRVGRESTLRYSYDPAEYIAASAAFELFRNGESVATFISGDSSETQGEASIYRGFPFDVEQAYDMEVVLNRGSDAEVRSDPQPVPLFQRVIRRMDEFVSIAQDVDIVNESVCLAPDLLEFSLNQEARITLSFRKIESLNADLSPNLGSPICLIDGEVFGEGDHGHPMTTADLLPGDYVYELLAVAVIDGQEEVRSGKARSTYHVRDTLPVGQTLVKGVNLFSGGLSIQRSDFSVPGRGIALEFSRSYSSHASDDDGGPLGIGWVHNYESRVIVTPCAEAIVIGGEGSGMRFVNDANGGLRPLSGYHGSLIANADLTFDFYTKAGTRYHYLKGNENEWHLDSITDPSGNTTQLIYQPSDDEPRLVTVRDPSGRELRFYYAQANFVYWSGEVLTRVTGPGGLEATFAYDSFGNLTTAEREPHEDGTRSQAEQYVYTFVESSPWVLRQLLATTRHLITGAETVYAYEYDAIPSGEGLPMVTPFVKTVQEPLKLGVTTFVYGLPDGRTAPQTEVIDRRQKTSTYSFDRHGRPTAIVDPEQNATTMTWAPDDAVMTSRTDGRGARTDFTYDTSGNVLTESNTITDFEGEETTYVKTNTYYPPTTFDPPYIKNRLHTVTDRDGGVTTYTYDSKGRLTETSITVYGLEGPSKTLVTSHTYHENGDRRSTTDRLNQTTWFTYDVYGNFATIMDPLQGITTTQWDVRSRIVQQTDARNHSIGFEYDTLNRIITRRYPDGAVERIVFEDTDRKKTAIDAEARPTVTFYDLEGQPIQIDNAAGGTKILEYDEEGNKILESSWFDQDTPRFDVTSTYDDAGRLTKRLDPLGRTTLFAYDKADNLSSETLLDSGDETFVHRVKEVDFDELNRPIEVRFKLGDEWSATRFEYSGEGDKVREIDPLGRETLFRYDELHRLLEVSGPEWAPGKPRIVQNTYDGNGQLTQTVLKNEPVDAVRRFDYDEAGRTVLFIDSVGEEWTREYDQVGNLTTETDPLLNTKTHKYDERNRLVETTVRLNRVTEPRRDVSTTLTYDKVGNVIEERWANGNVVFHSYDKLNRRTSTTDSLEPIVAYEYDARGNRTKVTDAREIPTVNRYDELNRLIESDLPEERTISYSYDAAGNRLTLTNARVHTTIFSYDALNRLVEVTDPEPFSYKTSFTYDLAGNQLTATDRKENTTTFEYDDLNRLIRQIEPPLTDGSIYTIEWSYDAADNLITALDRRNILTEHTYDTENRRTNTVRAGLIVEQLQYDAAGNLLFVTDANQHVTGFEHDERGLVLAVNRPLAAITRFTYDDIGNRVEERDPEGHVTKWTFDPRRRLETRSRTLEGGVLATATFGYDGNGNLTSKIRPETGTWLYTFDDANRLTGVTDPELGHTSLEYDKNSNVRSQTDDNTNLTRFEYDELDRRILLTYPDEIFEITAYDPSGNVLSHTDANGQTTTFSYDELDRLAGVTYPTDPTTDSLSQITHTYDPNNNLVQTVESFSQSGNKVTNRTYDGFDRLETVTDRWGNSLRYAYDSNGNRTQLHDPQRHVTDYSYDELNRMTSVITSGGVTEYGYYRNSRLKEITYPNGATAAYSYDRANRVKRIENLQYTSSVSIFEYDYDKNNNRTSQVATYSGQPTETTTYSYDGVDRLTDVFYPEKRTSYTYDGVGNRLTESDWDPDEILIGNKELSYNKRNQLTSALNLLDPTLDVTYGYDANGNRTSRMRGTEVAINFRYDVQNRLTEVTQGGATLATYDYDAQGLRIAKTTPQGTTRYVYDSQSVLFRSDESGTTKYEYGPDRLLSVNSSSEGRAFYLFDALGSVVNLITPQGTVLGRYQWDAWGNKRASLETPASSFGFTGHEHDPETGLIYAKARFYDPETGIFLSQDPIEGIFANPPSLHRYLYAFANPTAYTDPTGLQVAKLHEAQETLDDSVELNDEIAETRIQQILEGDGDIQAAYDELVALAVQKGAVNFASRFLSATSKAASFYVAIVLAHNDNAEEAWASLSQEERDAIDKDIMDIILFGIAAHETIIRESELIKEDPVKAASRADNIFRQMQIDAFVFTVRLLRNDPRARYDFTAAATETLLDTLTALATGVASGQFKIGSRITTELGEQSLELLDDLPKHLDDSPEPGLIQKEIDLSTIEGEGPILSDETVSRGARRFGPGAAHIDDPSFVSSSVARRRAMRLAGIPISQQPVSQIRTQAGRQLIYEVNGRLYAVTQQTTDRVAGHGPHWEVGEIKPPATYGLDPLGRARIRNEGKVKVEYGQE